MVAGEDDGPVRINELAKKLAGTAVGVTTEVPTTVSPLTNSAFFGYDVISVAWLSPLLKLGTQRTLRLGDVWPLPGYLRTTENSATFHALWQVEQERLAKQPGSADGRSPTVSLVRVLWLMTGRTWLFGGVLKLGYCCLTLLQPFLIKELLKWLTTDGGERLQQDGYILAVTLCVVGFCVTLCINSGFHYAYVTGTRVRQTLMVAIYEKALGMSAAATSNTINTLMSVEVERIWQCLMLLHWLWMAPLLVTAILALLVLEIGWAALPGVGLMLTVAWVQWRVSKSISGCRRAMSAHTTERTKLTGETLHAIRMVKMYVWESFFERRVGTAREAELRQLSRLLLLQTWGAVMMFLTPSFCAGAIFLTHIATGHSLTVSKTIAVMAYVGMLRLPTAIFSACTSYTAQVTRTHTREE
jgi:ABC-type multidrug transport system fused ATPase/permease subunit